MIQPRSGSWVLALAALNASSALAEAPRTVQARHEPGFGARAVEVSCRELEPSEFPGGCGTRDEWNAAYRAVLASFLRCEMIPGWRGRSSSCDDTSTVRREMTEPLRNGSEPLICGAARRHFSRCIDFAGRPAQGLHWCPPAVRPEAPLWECQCSQLWQSCQESTACPMSLLGQIRCYFSGGPSRIGEGAPRSESTSVRQAVSKEGEASPSTPPGLVRPAGDAR